MREYRELPRADQEVVTFVAFGQLVHVAVPSNLIQRAYGIDAAERAEGCYGGLIRRDLRGKSSGQLVYHMGGNYLALEIVNDRVRTLNDLFELTESIIDKLLSSDDDEFGAKFVRQVLERMAAKRYLLPEHLDPVGVARRLYWRFHGQIRIPRRGGRVTFWTAWAMTVRKFGDIETTESILKYLLKNHLQSLEHDPLSARAVLIGFTKIDAHFTDPALIGVALTVAQSFEAADLKNDAQRILTAAALRDVSRNLYERISKESRQVLLSKAEDHAQLAWKSGAPGGGNVLAQLLGGLAGPYTNTAGEPRPKVDEALQLVEASFESDALARVDPVCKTWRDVRSHRTAAEICMAAGRSPYLDLADWHLEKCVEGLPRTDWSSSINEQVTFMVAVLTDHGYFKWKLRRRVVEAKILYRQAIDTSKLASENRASYNAYWRYASFLKETGASRSDLVEALNAALAYSPNSKYKLRVERWLFNEALEETRDAVNRLVLKTKPRAGRMTVEAEVQDTIELLGELLAKASLESQRESARRMLMSVDEFVLSNVSESSGRSLHESVMSILVDEWNMDPLDTSTLLALCTVSERSGSFVDQLFRNRLLKIVKRLIALDRVTAEALYDRLGRRDEEAMRDGSKTGPVHFIVKAELEESLLGPGGQAALAD